MHYLLSSMYICICIYIYMCLLDLAADGNEATSKTDSDEGGKEEAAAQSRLAILGVHFVR
jgi:hypothetical protein